MRYQSRHVEVEAMRWVQPTDRGMMMMSEVAAEIVAWVNANGGEAEYHPGRSAVQWVATKPAVPPRIAVRTVNGWAYAEPGHYVIQGSAEFRHCDQPGCEQVVIDFYPCDPETFDRRWEPLLCVGDTEATAMDGYCWHGDGSRHPLPTPKRDTPIEVELERDVLLFGTAYERRHPDGRRERLDPTGIVVHTCDATRTLATANGNHPHDSGSGD